MLLLIIFLELLSICFSELC